MVKKPPRRIAQKFPAHPPNFCESPKIGDEWKARVFVGSRLFFFVFLVLVVNKNHMWEQAKMAPNPTEALRKVLRIVEIFSNDWIWVMETEAGLFGTALVAFIT